MAEKIEKESGIEKLIELLNEFETPQSGIVFKSYDDYDGTFYGVDIDGETEIAWSDSYICGKRFGWIKWLVENDKINTESGPLYGFHFIMHNRQPYSFYETILMLLSISDSPIDDLISYLK